jgi:hypothetical protein
MARSGRRSLLCSGHRRPPGRGPALPLAQLRNGVLHHALGCRLLIVSHHRVRLQGAEAGDFNRSRRKRPIAPMLPLLPAGPAGRFSPGGLWARRVCWSRRAYRVQRGKGRVGDCRAGNGSGRTLSRRGDHTLLIVFTQRKSKENPSAGGPLMPDELLMIDAGPTVRVGPMD